MRTVKVLVQSGDLCVLHHTDQGTWQPHFLPVVHPVSLQDMLLDEPSRKDGQPAIGILDVGDALDHTGQDLGCLVGGDDQLVGIVPDFGAGHEAVFHGLDVTGLDGLETVVGQ